MKTGRGGGRQSTPPPRDHGHQGRLGEERARTGPQGDSRCAEQPPLTLKASTGLHRRVLVLRRHRPPQVYAQNPPALHHAFKTPKVV